MIAVAMGASRAERWPIFSARGGKCQNGDKRGQRGSLFDAPVEVIMDGMKCNPVRHDEQPEKH